MLKFAELNAAFKSSKNEISTLTKNLMKNMKIRLCEVNNSILLVNVFILVLNLKKNS